MATSTPPLSSIPAVPSSSTFRELTTHHTFPHQNCTTLWRLDVDPSLPHQIPTPSASKQLEALDPENGFHTLYQFQNKEDEIECLPKGWVRDDDDSGKVYNGAYTPAAGVGCPEGYWGSKLDPGRGGCAGKWGGDGDVKETTFCCLNGFTYTHCPPINQASTATAKPSRFPKHCIQTGIPFPNPNQRAILQQTIHFQDVTDSVRSNVGITLLTKTNMVYVTRGVAYASLIVLVNSLTATAATSTMTLTATGTVSTGNSTTSGKDRDEPMAIGRGLGEGVIAGISVAFGLLMLGFVVYVFVIVKEGREARNASDLEGNGKGGGAEEVSRMSGAAAGEGDQPGVQEGRNDTMALVAVVNADEGGTGAGGAGIRGMAESLKKPIPVVSVSPAPETNGVKVGHDMALVVKKR